nr:MAG TPA: hypothetical protein [Caudoviricetes sp.]
MKFFYKFYTFCVIIVKMRWLNVWRQIKKA